jgi:hypothetical protein
MAGLRKTGVRFSRRGGNVGVVKMLEKLFVRVRSWLHIDPSAVGPEAATGVAGGLSAGTSAGMSGAVMAPGSANGGHAGTNGFARKAHATPTPPPMPGEAFGDSSEYGVLMEAQPDSGMVITESGIIIIDPNADEAKLATKLDAIPTAAKAAPSAPAQAVTADTSWALPNLAAPVGRNGADPGSSSSSDWDAVLARARAQLASPSPGSPAPSGKPRKA